jgi:hypothetical protein
VAAVLGDVGGRRGRDLNDLVDDRVELVAAQGVAAAGTGVGVKIDDAGGGEPGSGRVGSPGLGTPLLARGRTRRGTLDVRPIGGGRERGVGRVEPETEHECFVLGPQLGVKRDEGFDIAAVAGREPIQQSRWHDWRFLHNQLYTDGRSERCPPR